MYIYICVNGCFYLSQRLKHHSADRSFIQRGGQTIQRACKFHSIMHANSKMKTTVAKKTSDLSWSGAYPDQGPKSRPWLHRKRDQM